MAGRRIRCVCGTVFDPSENAACPACGVTTTTASHSPSAVESSSSSIHSGITRDSASSGFSAMGAAGAAQGTAATAKKGPIQLLIGLAVVILLAWAIRAKFGGVPPGKSPAKSGTDAVVRGEDDPTLPGESNDGSSPAPEPSKETPVSPPPRRPSPPPAPASEIAAFKGNWKLLTARMQPEAVIPGLPVTRSTLAHTVMTAFASAGAVSTMTITDAGTYVLEIDVSAGGFFTANMTPAKHLLSMAADGVVTFTPNGVEVSDRVRAMLRPVKFDMPQVDVKANDTELSLLPQGATGGATSVWFRPGDSGREHGDILGTWSYAQVFVDSYLPYRGTLELQDGGNYRIRFTRTEQGMLVAAGGDYEFKRSINMGPPVQGRYEFDGPNRFTLTEPRGTATWVREGPAAGTSPPKGSSPRGLRK